MKVRVVIVPGNGCSGDVRLCNWYGWMAHQLASSDLVEEVILRDMPDPVKAREKYWIPFLLSEADVATKGHRTIIIGHSSGAEAAMRLAEQVRVLGIVLVSACHTDLGMPSEALAGYYNRPWNWSRIKAHVGSFGILQVCVGVLQLIFCDDVPVPVYVSVRLDVGHFRPQLLAQTGHHHVVHVLGMHTNKFHSEDDPFIPMEEAAHVAENIESEFFQYKHKSHFFTADAAGCILESTLEPVSYTHLTLPTIYSV